MSKMSKTLKNIASDDNQPLTSNSDSPPKKLKRNSQASSLKTKLKYAGGFLVLLLLVIGGGVGYYLVQQRGVGDVRQQASTAAIMPLIGHQRTTIRAAGGYSQYPLAFLNDSPMLSEASATLYVPLFLRNWPAGDGNRQWTNISLYNPNDDAAEIAIDIYYQDGSKLGTINKTIAGHAMYNSYGDADILDLPVRDYDAILGYAKINSMEVVVDECSTDLECSTDNECKVASCDTVADPNVCEEVSKTDDTSCDDGAGRCLIGICTDWEDECTSDGDCDDDNICTLNTCDQGGHPYTCETTDADTSQTCTIAGAAGHCDGNGQCTAVASNETLLYLEATLGGVPYKKGETYYHPTEAGQSIQVGVNVIGVNTETVRRTVDLEYDLDRHLYAATNNGVLQAINLDDLPSGPYAVSLKGPMHRANRFCYIDDAVNNSCTLQEFLSQSRNITTSAEASTAKFVWLVQGETTSLDFTEAPLQPGDLPISGEDHNLQNGYVDVADYSFLVACLEHRQDEACVARADLNYTGAVDINDLFWMRKTLSSVADEL